MSLVVKTEMLGSKQKERYSRRTRLSANKSARGMKICKKDMPTLTHTNLQKLWLLMLE